MNSAFFKKQKWAMGQTEQLIQPFTFLKLLPFEPFTIYLEFNYYMIPMAPSSNTVDQYLLRKI